MRDGDVLYLKPLWKAHLRWGYRADHEMSDHRAQDSEFFATRVGANALEKKEAGSTDGVLKGREP